MAKFSDLFGRVLPEVPGCPKAVVEQEVRNAAIDFFGRTNVWTYRPDPVYVMKNNVEYELYDTPQDSVVSSVLSVMRGESSLTGIVPNDLDRYMATEGKPMFYTMETPGTLQLVPVAQESEQLRVRISVKPKPKAKSIPDGIMDEWADAFVYGGVYRLQMMADKPWGDPNRAKINYDLYQERVRNAKVKRVSGFGRTQNAVKSRRFG